mgnify:CR=1 FL=1
MNDGIKDCRIAGKIALDGQDILGDYDICRLRQRVGMVFQRPNPFPMSIYDNVAYGRAVWVCATASCSTSWSRTPFVALRYGMRSRTSSKSLRLPCPVVSSSVCASPARWPCGPTFC